MGGIINYYHGESGLVVDRQFVLDEEQRTHILRLQGDPNREFAFAYGGDVSIDPLLREGDTAVFVRIEQYGGLWVRKQDSLYPELQQAHDRVLTDIRNNSTPGLITVRLQGFWAEQYIAEETRKKTGSPFPERPATEASFFLSFSSQSVLLARQVFVWMRSGDLGVKPEHVLGSYWQRSDPEGDTNADLKTAMIRARRRD